MGSAKKLNITCISDLHGCFPKLPGGDLLLIAGDMTGRDAPREWAEWFQWLDAQAYRKKIFIAGNHDNTLQFFTRQTAAWEYLCDSGTEFEGLKIWGSPWTKTFAGMNPHCKAFTFDTEDQLAKKWALIPEDTHILITHSPPFSYLDQVENRSVGSPTLAKRLEQLPNLRLHIFGHIHEGFGKVEKEGAVLLNASHMNEDYAPVNEPISLNLEI